MSRVRSFVVDEEAMHHTGSPHMSCDVSSTARTAMYSRLRIALCKLFLPRDSHPFSMTLLSFRFVTQRPEMLLCGGMPDSGTAVPVAMVLHVLQKDVQDVPCLHIHSVGRTACGCMCYTPCTLSTACEAVTQHQTRFFPAIQSSRIDSASPRARSPQSARHGRFQASMPCEHPQCCEGWDPWRGLSTLVIHFMTRTITFA
jgi:hypothetical protein